jgi:selenocysteine-specific translation elongation factor
LTLEGNFIGVFGTDPAVKSSFENAIAKKSEVEGIIVYHRNEAGRRFSFLDDSQFPERIQGYARIASISDHAFYLFPKAGKLTPPDGELALLLQSFGLAGSVEVIDLAMTADQVHSIFKGTSLANFPVNQRNSQSSIIDLTNVKEGPNVAKSGTLIYIDRAFSVKGVGVVVLGFVLSGRVSIHDKLRLIPLPTGRTAEVKGIQINDEDHESAGRGIRVGLSLKGVEAKDLEKTSWLDDGSFELRDKFSFEFSQTPFYKQSIAGRELHLQLPGQTVVSKILEGSSKCVFAASLATRSPTWEGMKLCVLDLNAKNLRVAGGGIARA